MLNRIIVSRNICYIGALSWDIIAFFAGKPVPVSGDRICCMVQIHESMEGIVSALGEIWDRSMKAMPDEFRHTYDFTTVEHYELADKFSTAQL